MSEVRKCPVSGCPCPAESIIIYGLYSLAITRGHHEVALCTKHSLELWEKARGAVAAGLMHWEHRDLPERSAQRMSLLG